MLASMMTSQFKMNIINVGILTQIPTPELHQIVILESNETNEKVAIDFTPIPGNFATLKLILGKDVPGEIRIRPIPYDINTNDKRSILSFWKKDPNNLVTTYTYNDIKSPLLKKLISRVYLLKDFIQNDYRINLYKRNCRHFGKQVQVLYKKFIRNQPE
jgi:hypothetical protein